jgi:hypothetical protein
MTNFTDGLRTLLRFILSLIQVVSTVLRVNLELYLQFHILSGSPVKTAMSPPLAGEEEEKEEEDCIQMRRAMHSE